MVTIDALDAANTVVTPEHRIVNSVEYATQIGIFHVPLLSCLYQLLTFFFKYLLDR